MRLGCCGNMLARTADQTGVEIVENLRELGFDYIELPLAQIAALSEADFQQLHKRVEQSGIKCEACNNFFPTSIKLTGQEFDISRIMDYVNGAMDRAARLGVKVIVFGSGPAKMVPVRFPRSSAWEQLVDLLKQISVPARDMGLTVAIEPLRRQECNIINSAAEGLSLVRATDTEQVKLLIDYYHLDAEGESCRIMNDARDQLCHIHIAKPDGRSFPALGDHAIFQEFLDTLRAIDYQGRISIEAYSQDFLNDAARSLSYLQGVFSKR